MARNLSARRKLSELYKRGVEIRFGPAGGRVGPFEESAAEDEVALFVAPPSPLQRDQALREAQAKRARALIATKRQEDSEEHLSALAFLAEMSLPTLLDYVLVSGGDDRRGEAIRDVLARDEWKDIATLQDALRQFDEDKTPEDDEEFAAVLAEDAKYGAAILEREKELRDGEQQVLKMLTREDLEKRALATRSDLIGSSAFMREYERQMCFYSVREIGSHDVLFFDTATQFADQEDQIQQTVKDALATFITEGSEAKNLLGAVSGSDLSVPPSEPGTSEASIPEAASA